MMKASRRKELAHKVTDVLLELREACEDSEDYFALVEPLVPLIDAAIKLGGTRQDMMERLKEGVLK
jgi:hypothetical protein